MLYPASMSITNSQEIIPKWRNTCQGEEREQSHLCIALSCKLVICIVDTLCCGVILITSLGLSNCLSICRYVDPIEIRVKSQATKL